MHCRRVQRKFVKSMKVKLSDIQIKDFMKKAAFFANGSGCNYKIACVGVQSYKNTEFTNLRRRPKTEICKEPASRRGDATNKKIENLKKINIRSSWKLGKDVDKSIFYIKSYNETLFGEIYCQGGYCHREHHNLKGKELEKVCTIHAENNLIAKCANYGIASKDMVLFLTNSPCYICAKSIVIAGIKLIYYLSEHTDKIALEFLVKNNVKLVKLEHDFVFS